MLRAIRESNGFAIAVDDEAILAARDEVARWNGFDYLLVSGSAAEDVRRMQEIMDVERLRVHRQEPPWGL